MLLLAFLVHIVNIRGSMKVETVSLTALTPDPLNARKHSKRNLDAIAASLSKFGQRKPIVVTHDGVVIAGNGTLEAASSLDWKEISIARAPKDWDENTVRAYALADNQTGALAEWDDDVLNTAFEELTSEGWDIAELGFDLNIDVTEPLNGKLDDVPEAPVTPKTQLGDIYQLGEHRLMCGDSTDPVMVGILMNGQKADMMWTDPPYGVSYVGKTKDALTIDNDGGDNLYELLLSVFQRAVEYLKPGSPWYIAHPPGKNSITFGNAILEADLQFHETLIWVKDQMVLGHSDYHLKHEPIYYGWTKGPGRSGRGNHEGSRWYGNNSQVSIFNVDKPKRSESHPTMKPIQLIVQHLLNSSKKNDIVFEPFSGSGSTLIAAESLSRRCYAMELDPKYVEVAIERWESATGNKAVLL